MTTAGKSGARETERGGVRVTAPARLHFGFVNPGTGVDRQFGSLGLALEELNLQLRVERAAACSAAGADSARAAHYAKRLLHACGLREAVRVTVEQAIPAHAGLGSGTQLALATGTAVSELFGLHLSVRDIARILDRGRRSGIGIGAFERGGFMVDGGRAAGGGAPPVVSRIAFPGRWRVLLIFDERFKGLHDADEVAGFARLPPFPENESARLCQLVLMGVLPGLAERDLEQFGNAVSEIQRTVGDYFAPVQGGRFASRAVADALSWLEGEGAACVGQSSWGPTGFAIVSSEQRAQELAAAARRRAPDSALSFMVCRGRNRGAEVDRSAVQQRSRRDRRDPRDARRAAKDTQSAAVNQ
ncbi:MAG TPA: beta-ribofuranosylaminobenzene 5'-phosphate synthase family protein [Burkholderiales bacterium]|jgi:beta-RFAP synthase|nr:beta-ribofuranosylaminobenzene 5'-phosphate synthase family protein [Burkholderiales bacterium]